MENICEKEKCTGCFACQNACPKDAISVSVDQMGKTVPQIDAKKCINCGLCQKKCPQNSLNHFHDIQKCYAARTKNPNDQVESSSGGVAATFYRYFIEHLNGVIYGATFDEKLVLRQTECETIEAMEQFRGSKYVQSYAGKTYRQVEQRLLEGRKVLYIGTPCQIDALKTYLGKDNDNLLLVDLICHGVPPIKYLQEYANAVCRNKEFDKATFRGKNDFILCFYKKNELVYRKDRNYDYYFQAFLDGYTYRDNCYQCPYAQKQRVSDITIGDFWGLDRSTLKSSLSGRISTILLNSSKGQTYFKEMSNLFDFEEREIEEAVKGNSQLNAPVSLSNQALKFRNAYSKNGFIKSVKKTNVRIKILNNHIYEILRTVYHKLPFRIPR